MTELSLPVLPATLADEVRRQQIAEELSVLIKGQVRFGRHDCMLYATDASIYQVEPIGVVVPRSIVEAERVVQYCAEQKLPILPRGGGTSLAGQTVNHALVIDFSASCTRILEIDPEAHSARVEPGVVLVQLNQALVPHGLMFAPDVATAAQANLGGMIGNNSSGAHSIIYGRTVEHLRAIDVMLADGSRLHLAEGAAQSNPVIRQYTERLAQIIEPIAQTIDARYPKTRRNVGGYNLDLILKQLRDSTPGTFDRVNLAHLFCGSEGTLGVTLEAMLNLVPMPRRKSLTILAFPDVDAALASVATLLETKPAAVELIDDVLLSLAKENIECRRYLELMPVSQLSTDNSQLTVGPASTENRRSTTGNFPGALLYVEYFADSEDELRAKLDHLATVLPETPQRTFTDPIEMASAWKLRASGEPLLYGLPGRRKPLTFVEDAAVPPQDLPAFIRQFRAILEQHDTTAAYYAHASVGCLHVRPMIDPHQASDLEKMQSIARAVNDLVMQFGGAISGEHGDGRLRSHLLERFYGPEIVRAFQQIKQLFDPDNLLNPGNIVPADETPLPMTEHLRARPDGGDATVPDIPTYFRYRRERGFASAVEMCNGAGVCRKRTGGTMCPSYRATRDERHATRGRGNALRLAISGQLSNEPPETGVHPAWNDPETMRTLDLCLSCKACKSECPSNVDIARLKAEYLAQSYDNDGYLSLQTKLFAHPRIVNKVGSLMRAVANPLNRSRAVRWLMQRALGIDEQRTLPSFERPLEMMSLEHIARQRRDAAGKPCVILYPDCFTAYNEPHIGRAARQVLESLGYRVIVPQIGCCGRAAISVGMLPSAIDMASETMRRLISLMRDENAVAVVACEPSCVSAMIDDWVDLELNVDERTEPAIEAHCFAIEEFIESQWDAHPIRATGNKERGASRPSRPVLLHGHCHQKALWGVDRTVHLLRRFVGDRVQVIDSGCCGMAGSFGYTRDHFDLSMKIGELSLFPAVCEAPGAIVLAPGTSCRHQLRDGIERTALHPIEFLAKQLC